MAGALDAMIPVGLGLTVQELANLGAFGVVRESVKVFGGARPALVWIQFALVLPFTLFINADQYLQHKIIDKLCPDVPPPPSPPIVRLAYAGPLGHVQKWMATDLHKWLDMDLHQWLGLLSIVGLVLLSFFVGLVVLAAIYHAVGCIVQGRNVGFCEAMKGVPRLWRRLFVTSFVNMLLVLSSVAVFIIFVIIFKLAVPSKHDLLPIIVAVVGAVFLIPIFIIYLMFQVANGVTCFEEDYGVAAFRRAKHIMHGKWCSAVLLFILLAIPTTLLGALLGSPIAIATGFSWKLLVLVVVYVIFTSYLTELICICWAVFFFSCAATFDLRAPHDETLAASYHALPEDGIAAP
ncbi:hypothetical protein MPTK1_4g04630 [Marchantia polymorpha subsp. ruderalis]|nr:hypothetical protein MARPO_0044s0011 [Marchantia polymorpha]PTQ39531.1 hypothetical protein MARPO_0044s0011 [Marchantia polymorpha]BBN07568.1 hypothetical protein Mp_4g04630 [Marchantia polymorpha subsp. ruderalis]BBN07569.1 hypothetical protein Mp_4g04630 [Marchantia polymorpha subsp. ruderalis]|eukprot:PTQ39530.1 hypothetical protein MARPO_0044s0011 [Marchantia polymorpha]